MSKVIEPGKDAELSSTLLTEQDVVCSWCGVVIRSNASEKAERMCLICHARMLHDYYQRLREIRRREATEGLDAANEI